MRLRFEDLSNQVFGDLTVLERTGGPGKTTWWKCACDCGVVTTRSSQDIKALKRHRGCSLKPRADPLADHRRVIRKYQRHAKDGNREWSLTDEQAIELIERDCHYCKAPPSNQIHTAGVPLLYNGIDRVDNALGYAPGNVVPCCVHCNYAKRDRSARDFIAWAHRIARHTTEPPFSLEEVTAKDVKRHPAIADVLDLYAA